MPLNLDGNPAFAGNFSSPNGFTYFDAGAMTEISHANVETAAVAAGAYVDTGAINMVPTPGYEADYEANGQFQLEPLDDMLNAAAILAYELQNVADVHFSFIAFNDSAGNANTGLTPALYSDVPAPGYIPMISSTFLVPAPAPTANGTAIYIDPALPFVALDPNNANLNIFTSLPTIRPNGNRNVSAGLAAAIAQLTANGRTGANKVVVLFTSGVPTEANVNNAQALADAIGQAQSAAANGIPIYCVTISDPKSVGPPTDDSANDTAYGDSNGGIAALSAPGASNGLRYFRADWAGASPTLSNLSTIVDAIVREMVGMMN
jgi:hypothetical protein